MRDVHKQAKLACGRPLDGRIRAHGFARTSQELINALRSRTNTSNQWKSSFSFGTDQASRNGFPNLVRTCRSRVRRASIEAVSRAIAMRLAAEAPQTETTSSHNCHASKGG